MREPLHLRVVERNRRANLGNLVLSTLRRELHEPRDDRRKIVATTCADDHRRDRPCQLQRAILEQLVDDRGTPLRGLTRVRERHAQLVIAFDDAREAEQLVLDIAQPVFRLRDLEQRLRPRLDAVSHDQLLLAT